MKVASKIAAVLGGLVLQTTSAMASSSAQPKLGIVEFGQIPGLTLIKKTSCNEPSYLDYCILPNSREIKEEIRNFVADADRRKAVVQSRLPLLLDAARRLQQSAGTDSSLPSYAFYMKAAQQVAGIVKNEKTTADVNFFDKSDSQALAALEQLLKVVVDFESKIARASDPSIRDGLMLGRNQIVQKLMMPVYDMRTYAVHLRHIYFDSETRILTTYSSINEPRRFSLDAYITIASNCCDGNTGVDSVAITKYGREDQYDSLTLLEDQATIKGILDGPVKLTFQSQKVFGNPELRYDRATNTITREYKRRGSPFVKRGDEIWANGSLVQLIREIYQN